jgi:hypothetical protein
VDIYLLSAIRLRDLVKYRYKSTSTASVVRVPGYRTRGPGFDSGVTRFSEK